MSNAWHGIPQRRSEFRSLDVLSRSPTEYSYLIVQILASASYDDTIKLYQDDPSDDWFCAATLTGHGSTVWGLAWEPKEGRYLASSSDDQTIRLWRRLPGKGDVKFECAAVIEGHERSVYSISWAPAHEGGQGDLGWLASTGGDGTVLIWHIIVSGLLLLWLLLHALNCLHRRHPTKQTSHGRSSTSWSLDWMELTVYMI